MKYFDLIHNESKEINVLLDEHFPHAELVYINSSFKEITCVVNNDLVRFVYNTDRYDDNGIMNLKGVRISIDQKEEQTYSLNRVVSFFEHDCKKYVDNFDLFTLSDTVDRLGQFYKLTKENPDWEVSFNTYKKSKAFPW